MKKKLLGIIAGTLVFAVGVYADTNQQSPFFTGNGGKGMSITILAPKASGLAEDQGYIPAVVQGELVSTFSGYSAISVLDRERLDSQYLELLQKMGVIPTLTLI